MSDTNRGGRRSAASVYELSYTSLATKRNRVVRIIADTEDDVYEQFNDERFRIQSVDYVGTIWACPKDAFDAAVAEEADFTRADT